MPEETKTTKITESNHRELVRLLPYGETLQEYHNKLLARQLRIEDRKQAKASK